jgi:broad specificity phosphatase PhoE
MVIRHAHSTANDSKQEPGMSATDLAFANQSAGLSERGMKQCAELAQRLSRQLDLKATRVARSYFVRTQMTAELVGFRKDLIRPDHALDEVEYEEDMDLETLRSMLRQNRIPDVALRAARETLRHAPSEGVWITHGLLIAGLSIVLDVTHQYPRLVPLQCEVRTLTF